MMPHFTIDEEDRPQTIPWRESSAWNMSAFPQSSETTRTPRQADANDTARRSESPMSDASASTTLTLEAGSEPSDSASATELPHWIEQYAGHSKICPDLVTHIRDCPDFAQPIHHTHPIVSALGQQLIYTVQLDMGGSKWPGREAKVTGAYETLDDANRAVVDTYMNYRVFPAEWIKDDGSVPLDECCTWFFDGDGALRMRHDDYRLRDGYECIKAQCMQLTTSADAQRRRHLTRNLLGNLSSVPL